MYLSLIDTVSKILKTYGADILSDPKFWHILSDSYSFGNEYALKDTFKSCLSTDYISKLIAIKGNSKKTKAEIAHIVDSEDKLNPGKEKEYAAVLYSIAIAIGSCNKKDYSDFINRNNPQSAPAPTPKPNKPSNNPKTFSIRHFLSLLKSVLCNYARIIIVGLISVSVSTLLYGLYVFSGWWMFFVLLLIGLIQMSCCGYLLISVDNVKNRNTQSDIASIGFPFIIAYFANSLMSFFFQGDEFRWDIYNYFGDWQPKPVEKLSNLGWDQMYRFTHHTVESPGLFSLLLGFLLLALFIGCAYGLFNNSNPRPQFKIKYSILSLVLIIIIESGIFIYPTIKHKIQESNYLHKEVNISEQIASQQKHNNILISSRASETKDLSFKGIKLGISWDTANGYAQTIVESDSSSNRYLNRVEDEYFYTYFRDNNDVMETLTKAYESYTPKDSGENDYFMGKLLKFNTTLDNQEVCVKIFGIKNKVYAIIITPSGISSYRSFEKYDDLVELYTKKYGEPELIRDRAYYEDSYYSDNTIYCWTFKNGIVRLTKEYVVYVPTSFFTLANEIASKKRLEQEAEEQRLKYLQFQQDSIKKAKQLADSLRQVRNHDNAINEI